MNQCLSNRLILTLLIVCVTACAGGQNELISLVKQTQEDLSTCRTQLTSVQVKDKLSSERRRDRDREFIKLKKMIDAERERLKTQRQLRSNNLDHDRSSKTVSLNLRKLNQEQISIFVKSVGGDIKLVGNRLMAVFGKIKTQLIYNSKDHVLTAHARFKGYNGNLDFINDWNRTKRFSRAYLDRDGDVVLETEVDIEPGMSEEAIKTWIKGFGVILNFFQHSLAQRGRPSSQPNPQPQAERHRI